MGLAYLEWFVPRGRLKVVSKNHVDGVSGTGANVRNC